MYRSFLLFDVEAFTLTAKPFINEDEGEESLRANYLWFEITDKEYFFLKSSLKELLKHLSNNFVRINESYIANVSP